MLALSIVEWAGFIIGSFAAISFVLLLTFGVWSFVDYVLGDEDEF